MTTTRFRIIRHAYKDAIIGGLFMITHSGRSKHMCCGAGVYDGVVSKQIRRGKW